MSAQERVIRFIGKREQVARVPIYAVWELTLKCNLKCQHCGSRAGSKRENELSTDEALDLVEQFADLGVRELALIGGEAYLRQDWLEIVSKASSLGMKVVLQTGGYGFSSALAQRAKSAGLNGVGVSIDGLELVHDRLRGVEGSYSSALMAINAAKAAGLSVTANTQINAHSESQLEGLFEVMKRSGVEAWQLQLTVAMGNAVDDESILLQPYQLAGVFPRLAKLFEQGIRNGVQLLAGNNIGYFGPYEHLWRGPLQAHDHYEGCYAGINGLGIEADGTVKGCPSLATDRYSEGNIRNSKLRDLWTNKNSFSLNQRGATDLWGFCKSCYYSTICRGGCAWTSDSLFGKPGNNPYCHHRVLELKSSGRRERVVKVSAASKKSFGTGLFSLIEEPWEEGQ